LSSRFEFEHFTENEKNPPSRPYIDVITKGLIQAKGWSLGECEQYIKKFI